MTATKLRKHFETHPEKKKQTNTFKITLKGEEYFQSEYSNH